MTTTYPSSPRQEIEGLPYFPRMCEKIRLFATNSLPEDLHDNLGKGMDLWTCDFLGIHYADLKEAVLTSTSDGEALAWAKKEGQDRSPEELAWFRSYLLNRGFRDDLSERLQQRVEESGFQDRSDIFTFCDYIDADEGRI